MLKKKWMAGILAATMLIACVCPTEIVMAEENSTGVESESQVTDQAETNGDFEIKNGELTKYTGKGGDVVIPKGVTRIGNDAFRNCEKLKSISIPESVTYIGQAAFLGCSKLKNVKIPSRVNYIKDLTFAWCSELESVELPEGVKAIGESVFAGCSKLVDVNIPSSVERIDMDVFSGCSKLESISIPDGITEISERMFEDCGSLNKVDIPSSVTTIETAAFSGCTGLTGIDIPSGVKQIQDYAFEGCTGLTSVKIPSGVKSLEAGAFFRCSNLTGIDIPSSVKKIGYGVFRQCNRQLVITCKSGSYAEQYAKDNGIKYNYSQNSAGIPDKGKVLKSGKTTYTVTKKGKEAAYTKTASQASDITVPETVTIDHISYKVTSISSDAFKNNKKLKKVTIGKNVTMIGNGAFRGCGKLETVTIRSSKLKSVGKKAFKGIKSNVKIKVPAKQLKAYKKLLKGKGLSSKAKITK